MKSKNILIILLILIISTFLIFYPKIEFYHKGKIYMMSYSRDWTDSEDLKELEQDFCYNEVYSYNKKRNISISSWEYKKFLIFRWFKINYKKGNVCETEYLLEELYIQNIIENAIIIENEDNIDLNKLVQNKTAIEKNKRYPLNENRSFISFELDNKVTEMYVWTNEDGLLVIQVGSIDESPKYIAFK